MLYRIDLQHFLIHAVDYFTQDELLHCQYVVLSCKLANQKRIDNVCKASLLWPDVDLITRYAEMKDYEAFKKEYFDFLDTKATKETNVSWSGASIYNTIIHLLLEHEDVVIICDREENYIVDAFCEYLNKKWHAEAIDLNVLFSKGQIGPYYIDRDDIKNRAVDIRRAAGRDMLREMDATPDGRLKHLRMMNKKEKITKLKSMGIHVRSNDNLDALLIDAWVNADNEE